MAIGPALLLDVALDSRVQRGASWLFDTVYSRIFKDSSVESQAQLIDARPVSAPEAALNGRLDSIENRLGKVPTNDEMAFAFASLQAEVRLGQKRLWLGLAGLAVLNTALISVLIFR